MSEADLSEEELEEQQAKAELMAMPRAELDKVPFDIVHWRCKIKCCTHYTRLRNYGVAPHYYHTRFGWIKHPGNFFICGGHNKLFKTRWKSDWDNAPLRSYWGWNDTIKPVILY